MLYIALSPARAQIKIGYSRGPSTLSQRMRNLHCQLLAVYENGTRTDESNVQRHLADSALPDGEWFDVTFDTCRFVGEFCENAFLACVHAMSEPRARLPKHRISAQRHRRITAATNTGSR